MSKKILLLILCLLAISGCQREKEVRIEISLERPLYDFAKIYYELNDYENAVLIYKKILLDIETQEDGQNIDKYWIEGMIARIYLEMEEYDLAKVYIEDAIKGYQECGETEEGYAFACQTEGIYFEQIGQYEKAIECFEKSIEYTDLEDDHSVRSYIEMGLSYGYLDNEKTQLECYERALEYSESKKDNEDLYQVYNILGGYYTEKGD